MSKWSAFPHDASAFDYDRAELKRLWKELHAGDAEPWPSDARAVDAWRHFHAGRFRQAVEAGLAAGGAGLAAANKAQAIYAHYLERRAERKLRLLLEVAERAEAQQVAEPERASAHYWQAYALGRYSQGISVVKALAQGLGAKVKARLERTIELAPKHADAHLALAAFHAEVVDSVGRLMGRAMGADADEGVRLYRRALKLDPASPIAALEAATGLVQLDRARHRAEARKLLERAAAATPRDAMERLDVEAARAELAG